MRCPIKELAHCRSCAEAVLHDDSTSRCADQHRVYTQRLHLYASYSSYWLCLQQLAIGRQWQLNQVCSTGQPPETWDFTVATWSKSHSAMHERSHLIPKQHIATSLPSVFGELRTQETCMEYHNRGFSWCRYSAMLSAISPCYAKLGGVKQCWMKKSLPTFTCNSLRDVRLSCMLVPPSESTIPQWFVEVAGAKSSKATMPVVTSAQAACAAYTNGQAVVN